MRFFFTRIRCEPEARDIGPGHWAVVSLLLLLALVRCEALAPRPELGEEEALHHARRDARGKVMRHKPLLVELPEPRIRVTVVDGRDVCPPPSGGCSWYDDRHAVYRVEINSRCNYGYRIAVHEFMHVYLSHERYEGRPPLSFGQSEAEMDHTWMGERGYWRGEFLECHTD